MTSPAKRLRGGVTAPAATPIPLALGLPPTDAVAATDIPPGAMPHAVPVFDLSAIAAQVPVTAPAVVLDDQGDVVEAEDNGPFNAVASMPFDYTTGEESGVPAPQEFMDAAAALFGNMTSEMDGPLIAKLDELISKVGELTTVVNVIGQQQQWTTDTVASMFEDFKQMMAGGNPLKMIGMMMGKKGQGNG